MTNAPVLYIDGSWTPSEGTNTLEVFDSSNGEVFATIVAGSPADVDRAVDAARRAFDDWSTRTPDDRAKFCDAAADGLEARADELATVISPRDRHAQVALGTDPGVTARRVLPHGR